MVELCEQLVHRGVILHANGTSIMPRALLDALLCESREQARTTELERLSNDARALGRMLSVLRSMGPKALVAVLADGDSAAIESQLAELERADVHVAATLADAGLGHEAEHWVRLHASDQLDESTQMLESTAS